jgi:hypothetical protein
MYVIVQHQISDPERFFAAAQQGMADLLQGLTLYQVSPARGGRAATCLWEAGSIENLQSFLEPAVGNVAQNTYYEVDEPNAFGLPRRAAQTSA